MLSEQARESYRRMTPRERIAEMRALLVISERVLRACPPEEARKRLDAETRIRRTSIDALLKGLRGQGEENGDSDLR